MAISINDFGMSLRAIIIFLMMWVEYSEEISYQMEDMAENVC